MVHGGKIRAGGLGKWQAGEGKSARGEREGAAHFRWREPMVEEHLGGGRRRGGTVGKG